MVFPARHPLRAWLIALLAMLLVTMQWFGNMHRVLHAPHAAASAPELWLVVANGGEVTAAAWAETAHELRASSFDPWSHHHSTIDCAAFDALCTADTPISIPPALAIIPRSTAAFARPAIAAIDARLLRPRARAPPLTTPALTLV